MQRVKTPGQSHQSLCYFHKENLGLRKGSEKDANS